jgi:hypothetical protein
MVVHLQHLAGDLEGRGFALFEGGPLVAGITPAAITSAELVIEPPGLLVLQRHFALPG